jgi:hypothetical protein
MLTPCTCRNGHLYAEPFNGEFRDLETFNSLSKPKSSSKTGETSTATPSRPTELTGKSDVVVPRTGEGIRYNTTAKRT